MVGPCVTHISYINQVNSGLFLSRQSEASVDTRFGPFLCVADLLGGNDGNVGGVLLSSSSLPSLSFPGQKERSEGINEFFPR